MLLIYYEYSVKKEEIFFFFFRQRYFATFEILYITAQNKICIDKEIREFSLQMHITLYVNLENFPCQ